MEINSVQRSSSSTAIHFDVQDVAGMLRAVLRTVPSKLVTLAGTEFPMLDALRRSEPAAARALMLIGAIAHRSADERRTAEYLLRNRARLSDVGAERLLASARCAAEMDVRRLTTHLVLSEMDDCAAMTHEQSRDDDPSVGEMVVRFARDVAGVPLDPIVEETLIDAVVVFMRLAKRHAEWTTTRLSIVAMRTTARHDARLVTNLRRDGFAGALAVPTARLLIGADESAPEAALLWWAARGAYTDDVPATTVRRWQRDIGRITVALLNPGHAA